MDKHSSTKSHTQKAGSFTSGAKQPCTRRVHGRLLPYRSDEGPWPKLTANPFLRLPRDVIAMQHEWMNRHRRHIAMELGTSRTLQRAGVTRQRQAQNLLAPLLHTSILVSGLFSRPQIPFTPPRFHCDTTPTRNHRPKSRVQFDPFYRTERQITPSSIDPDTCHVGR